MRSRGRCLPAPARAPRPTRFSSTARSSRPIPRSRGRRPLPFRAIASSPSAIRRRSPRSPVRRRAGWTPAAARSFPASTTRTNTLRSRRRTTACRCRSIRRSSRSPRRSVRRSRPPAGRLIKGEFAQAAWGEPSFTRAWLDAIAPDHPVWLTAFTGHGALLNSAPPLVASRCDRGSGGWPPRPRGAGRLERPARGIRRRSRGAVWP